MYISFFNFFCHLGSNILYCIDGVTLYFSILESIAFCVQVYVCVCVCVSRGACMCVCVCMCACFLCALRVFCVFMGVCTHAQ